MNIVSKPRFLQLNPVQKKVEKDKCTSGPSKGASSLVIY